MRLIVCGVLVMAGVLAAWPAAAQPRPEVAFRLPERDLVPEGLAYDPVTRAFFVGSTYKRKIVRIDADGHVSDLTSEGQDGLRAVLGLRVDAARRRLWAISSHAGRSVPIKGSPRDCIGCSTVLAYDLASGGLVQTWSIDNVPVPHFFNDLVVTPSGDVYITDTVGAALYRIPGERGTLERFVDLGEGSAPNGIDLAADGSRLFVGVAGGIATVDLASRQVGRVQLPDGLSPGIDGLYVDGEALIAIQPFDEARAVVRYVLPVAGEVAASQILDSGAPPTEQPTTGVIVGDEFYYIANSQLQHFRRLQQADDTYDADQLSAIVILRVPLR